MFLIMTGQQMHVTLKLDMMHLEDLTELTKESSAM